jgi:Flp pilus assembly protein TadD
MQSRSDDLIRCFERTPIRPCFDVPQSYLDDVMARAYQFYRAGSFQHAETLCRGLIALDPRYWWVYSLHAAVLRRLGRFEEALAQIQRGLSHEPAHPKLLAMQRELHALARHGVPTSVRPHAAAQGATP